MYWAVERYLRVNAIAAPTTTASRTPPIEIHIMLKELSSSSASVAFGSCWLLVEVSLLGDLCATCSKLGPGIFSPTSSVVSW